VLAISVVAAVVGTHHEPAKFTSGTAVPEAAIPTTDETVAAAAVPRSSSTTSTAVTRAVRADDALPRHSGTGRRVVYSISEQRVWTVGSAGQVQRTYLVSGRLSQPGPGRYRVYSKSRWTSSTVSAETMQYMVRFTHGERTGSPIGFHSIPRDYAGHAAQSVEDLGKPLSAGCIRQRMRDAVYLWDFAHVGTPVIVTR
jgi:lipoprotein-anchoring transpeptidase ErfK/SrfK